jgi:hypothetical protein
LRQIRKISWQTKIKTSLVRNIAGDLTAARSSHRHRASARLTAVERHCFMRPSSWDKQMGLASPRESAASQSDQTNNPSKNEVGLDVSHHARISQRGGEKLFSLTSFFIG